MLFAADSLVLSELKVVPGTCALGCNYKDVVGMDISCGSVDIASGGTVLRSATHLTHSRGEK